MTIVAVGIDFVKNAPGVARQTLKMPVIKGRLWSRLGIHKTGGCG
ncbi:MAG: hypothetical protein Q7T07_18980 [Burkholderiaceae bacterium]|nr:hypothetical protein [Burkholderiaceae bacterium]